MKISVLGSGNMGKALVKQLANHSKSQVLWGSRNPSEAATLAVQYQLGNVVTGSYEDALQADIIIPAFHVPVLVDWVKAYQEQLRNKIVVDISNPFNEDYSGFTTSWGESSAEKIQSLLPDSIVVGAFKNTFFKVVEEPEFQDQISDVLVTSDDEAAILQLIEQLKPLPFRFINAGKLANNRTIERFTLLELELAVRYNTYPYISLQLFGLKEVMPVL